MSGCRRALPCRRALALALATRATRATLATLATLATRPTRPTLDPLLVLGLGGTVGRRGGMAT